MDPPGDRSATHGRSLAGTLLCLLREVLTSLNSRGKPSPWSRPTGTTKRFGDAKLRITIGGIVALVGFVAAYAVFKVATDHLGDANKTEIVTLAMAVLTFIGTVVGTFVGVHAGASGKADTVALAQSLAKQLGQLQVTERIRGADAATGG